VPRRTRRRSWCSTPSWPRRAEDAAAHAFAAQVAEAAVAVAGAIVGRELGDETVAATAAAQRALAALGRERGAVLRLHPADVALLGTGDLPGDVRLVPDPTLARGDALAETDDRTVDARIGTALGRALAVLAGTEEHPA